MTKPAAKKAALQGLGLIVMLLLAMLLAACQSNVDKNSTAISATVRPVNPNQGDVQSGTLPTDPTRNPASLGATSTPGQPTPTLPAGATAAPANPTSGGGSSQPAATTAAASGGGGGAGNPTTGLAIFRRNCTSCHANNGRAAGVGPNLTNSANAGSADYIRNIVRNGKGTMPAFDKDTVSDADLDNLVAYVLSIRAK